MKNHELLDLIGGVDEDYVRAADEQAPRPRFGWKKLALCAACAALVLGLSALPLTSEGPEPAPEGAQDPGVTLVRQPGLHDYFLIDRSLSASTTQGDSPKLLQPAAPGGGGIDMPGQNAPEPNPDQPPRGSGPDPTGGAPAQEDASAQYARLLQWWFGEPVPPSEPGGYPDWFGGAWIDGELLTVAIVDGFRTPALEEQIRERTGGGALLFTGAAYSQNHLDGLMEQVGRTLDELDCRVFLSYGVYAADNRIHLDFSQPPDDQVLSALAQLDPAGDAILIQVFTGTQNLPTGASAKGPAPDGPAPEPVGPEARAAPTVTGDGEPTPTPADGDEPDAYACAPAPGDEPDAYAPAPGGAPIPGGAPPAGGPPEANQVQETGQPAHYDVIYGEGR